ncbi:MAG: right-handed parallel beta-helix repeat-containing protein [bacterium]|nr:right-handed parallel beta-helix repeat-containing protein [bacterium]
MKAGVQLDNNFSLGTASLTYKGGKNFYVIGKAYDYLAGSATISIEIDSAGEYAKDSSGKEIKGMKLKPLQVGTASDVSQISGDKYNTYFAYKLNLKDLGTGTHHLRVTITNPAGLTTIATTKDNNDWIPFTITESRVQVRVAMAASPAVDIPQGMVAKADCYYFDNQGHEYEKPLNDNLCVDSDSIIRYNYAGNTDNPNYSHRILLESTVRGLDDKKPITSVVDGNSRAYTYASFPFNLIETTNADEETVYLADVDKNGTITDKDVVVIRNNRMVNVPGKQEQTISTGVGSIAPGGVNIAYPGGMVTTPAVSMVTQQISYDTYTNPVGALYILKSIQQAYDYTRSVQPGINLVVNAIWAQNKDYTTNGVSSYGSQSGRIEINGAVGDEFKPDRICQAYGNYLLSYHCSKQRKYQTTDGSGRVQLPLTPQRPEKPEKPKKQGALSPDEAFVNGFCMRYSSGVRGADTAGVPGSDEIVQLGSSTHRGVNSSIAVAQALFRLPMQQIWQALYHPAMTLTHSGCTVLDLLDEIDLQFGARTTESIRQEFFGDEMTGQGGGAGTSGTTSASSLQPSAPGTACRLSIRPAKIVMPVGGTAMFELQAYDEKGSKTSISQPPEWQITPGFGSLTAGMGTSATFISGNTCGTVTITVGYGSMSAAAEVVIVEKGPVEVFGACEGVWFKRLSPYIVTGDITVDRDRTLRIEPGVTVAFMRGDKKEYYDDLDPEDYKDDPWIQGIVILLNEVLKGYKGERKEAYNRRTFTVKGRLEAEGTETERIVFTSGKKINVELGVYEGIWKHLEFDSSSSGVLRYCDMLHGGRKVGSYRMDNLQIEPQVLIKSSDVSMEKCRIYESAGIGIQLKGATGCILRANEISGPRKEGVVIEDSRDILIEGNSISGIDGYGIISRCGVTGTITKNKVSAGIFPFCQDGTSFPWYSNNIIDEGKGVAIMNGQIGLPETGVLRDAGMPYFIHRVSMPQGCSLRIEKGVVFILGQLRYESGDEYRNSGKIWIGGRLYADGVTFRSRGEGCWPWNSIILAGEEASGSIIKDCTFDGGGYIEENQYGPAGGGYGGTMGKLLNETGMIVIENSGPRIEGCVFKGTYSVHGSFGSRSGIMLKNSQEGLVITNNRIENMRSAGIILRNCQHPPMIYNNIFSKNRVPFYQDADSSVRCKTNTYIENANTAIMVGDIRNPIPYGGGTTPPIMGKMHVPLSTWYKQDLPYLIESWFEVSAGSTLRIEPGVIVKTKKSSPATGLDIHGRLEAEGTAELPIIFTSVNDDEYYDDNKPEPKPGEGIVIGFYGIGRGVFKHCVVKYGDGIRLWSPNSPVIEDCSFTKNAGCAISVENASPVIKNNTISHNVASDHAAAITLKAACPRIENNIISQNKGNGVYHGIWGLDSQSCPVIIGNTIEDNGGCAYCHPHTGRFIYQGNIVKGNGYQAIGILGTDLNRIDRDTIWKKEDLPYFVMFHGVTVDKGKTLVIEPGVVVKFMDMSYYKARLLINGNMVANGTKDEPIVFTSMYDDSAGSKIINLEGFKDKSPYPGSCGGIVFVGGRGTLTNCFIRYGISGLRLENEDSGNKRYADVVIKNSEIKYNSEAGVRNCIEYSYCNWGFASPDDKNKLVMDGCTVTKNGWEGISSTGRLYGTLTSNNIYNNGRSGIFTGYDGSGSIVMAAHNWWGTMTPTFEKDLWWWGKKTRMVFEPWLREPLPDTASFIDHISISPATVTIGQEIRWMFNVGAYDRDNYLLPSPGFKWETDEGMGSLTTNDTMAIFQAGTRTGTTSITVRWGSLSTTAQIKIIEYNYGTLSGTFAMRRDKEIWLMSWDGKILREISRDKTCTYPKISREGRYLAYGKQGYSEKQRSLFMCDLQEGVERIKLPAYWYWEGTGPQRRTIRGWTFAPWELRGVMEGDGWWYSMQAYTPLEPSLFLNSDNKYYYTKFNQQDVNLYRQSSRYGNYDYCGYHYPAMDNSGRIFGYKPDDKAIYCWDKEKNNSVVLVSSIKNNPYPSISPDGVWMAYLNDGDIYIMDIKDRSNIRRVTMTNKAGGPFAWLSDGQSLVYPQQDAAGSWDLWMIRADGKCPENITHTPNIDEDQVDWSPADIMENMPRVSRIGIVEPEVAVVPNGSITLNACVYYQMPDYEGYPMEYRIIGGMDLGTVTWGLDGGIGMLSGTSGKQVVFYGGEEYKEGTISLSWGSYTTQLRAVVTPSTFSHKVRVRGTHGAGNYPIMEVWIDGKRAERGEIGEEWIECPVRYSLTPGTHTISICFTNRWEHTGRNLVIDWLKVGSMTILPTQDLIYDSGQSGSSSTWFDGIDLISTETRKRYNVCNAMPWTGALMFKVCVEGNTVKSSKAAVMPQIITGLSEKVYVFPNPWKPEDNYVTFLGVVEGARLKVYNIAGENVFEKVLDAGEVNDKKYLWKPQNNDGQTLASGVYFYIVSYMDEIRIGRIGVVK